LSFIAELKRRNVFKVGVAYLVSSWLLIQVADILLDNIGAPAWVLQTIFVLLGVGFFIAMFFAWAFELTPEGVKREKEVDRSQSIAPQTGKKLNNAILVLMALAIGYLLFDKFSAPSQPGSDHFSQQTAGETTKTDGKSALTPIEAITQAKVEEEPAISKQSIAVLPFDNRSRVEDDEFFVEGVHDDLLTNLARISALKVISRTSVLRYKNTEMPIPAIAAELGVATIMEGAVQRSGNTVRINVQLIDAKTDEHLWAEIYDRELTAGNLFAIQSEISQAIADALQATLTPDEKGRINTAPTENLKAHDTFLRGRQLMARRESEPLEQAVVEFRKAVELDPQFALAWVGLADSYYLLALYGTALSMEESIPLRQDAVNHALEIDDQLGEAYASQGQIYFNQQQDELAEKAYLKAIELSPNYSVAWMWYAVLLGDFPLRIQDAVDAARKAVELDPASAIAGVRLGAHYRQQGLYSLAERQYQRVLELEPDFAQGYRYLADFYQFSTGQYARALPLYEKAYELDPGNLNQQGNIAELYLNVGDIQGAEKIRDRMIDVDTNNIWAGFIEVEINLLQDNPDGAREAINWLLPKVKNQGNNVQWLAMLNLLSGDEQGARDIFVSADPGWTEQPQWQGLIEHYATMGCIVSWLFMNTGDEQLGSDLLAQTTTFLEQSLPAVIEHADLWQPDICYLAAGDKEKALTSIETQLSHNHLANWPYIHDLPIYDEIRFNPRYQAVVEEYQRRVGLQREAIEAARQETGS
jgi:TolB-like protein